MDLGLDGWMVAWNPDSGDIEVGPWPDIKGWSNRYRMTTGCCLMARHDMTAEGKAMMLFIDFHSLVVRSGIHPQRAHGEFLKIAEYRRRIAPDIPGAER